MLDILCLYPFNVLECWILWVCSTNDCASSDLTNIQYVGEVFTQLAAEFYWRLCVASGDLHIIEGEILCLYFYLHRCICIYAGVFVFFLLFFLFAVVNIVWRPSHITEGEILYTWTVLHSTSPLWQTKDKN